MDESPTKQPPNPFIAVNKKLQENDKLTKRDLFEAFAFHALLINNKATITGLNSYKTEVKYLVDRFLETD